MWQPDTFPIAYTIAAMMNPNANEIPSRSAPVIAGTDLPASCSVATTEPGPTRTSSAVPSTSATARCANENLSSTGPSVDHDSIMSNRVRGTYYGARLVSRVIRSAPALSRQAARARARPRRPHRRSRLSTRMTTTLPGPDAHSSARRAARPLCTQERGPPRRRPARRRGRRRRRPARSRQQGGVSLRLASLRALLRQLSREESHAPSFARNPRQSKTLAAGRSAG